MRVAIYARYSSDLQSPNSIEDQVRLCRERAGQTGAEVIQVYADAAISGAHILNRPGIVALMADAKRGRFDAVITEALDRLSRDQEDIAGLYKRLGHAGVSIVTLSEGEISELHVGLKGTMNALFLKDMAAKVRRGQRGRIEKGRAGGGGLGYGYRVVRKLGADGEPERGIREIDQDQAAVIRRIYTDYLTMQSARTIAAALNREGMPAPRGGQWNASTINGNAKRRNGILHNELYIGKLIYNRQSFRKDPDTGKRVPRPNPPEQWITVEVPDLRIIDDETWRQVQEMHRQIGALPQPLQRRPKHMLSGLLRCGCCGGPYTRLNSTYLSCAWQRERGTCTNKRKIRLDRVEASVLAGVRENMLAPEVVAEYVREYHAAVAEMQATADQRAADFDRRLSRLETLIGRAVDAVLEGTATAAIRQRLAEMEQEKAALILKRDQVAPAPIKLHPGLAEQYRVRLTELRAALGKDANKAEAAIILRELVTAIVVHPGARSGEAELELVGQFEALSSAMAGTLAIERPQFLKKRLDLVVAPDGFVRSNNTFSFRLWMVR